VAILLLHTYAATMQNTTQSRHTKRINSFTFVTLLYLQDYNDSLSPVIQYRLVTCQSIHMS